MLASRKGTADVNRCQSPQGPRYRGVDRRRPIEPPLSHPGLASVYGGLVFGSVVLALSWRSLDSDLQPARIGVHTGVLLLLVIVATTAQLDWRATGRSAGCLLSTGAWLLAASHALSLPAFEAVPVAAVVRWSLYVQAALWFVWALTAREVDTDHRPGRYLLATVAITGSAGLLASAVADTTLVLVAVERGTFDLSAAGAWAAVSVIGLLHLRRGTAHLTGWLTWLAVAILIVTLGRYLAVTRSELWATLAGEVALLAVFLAAGGAIYGLFQCSLARREHLHETMIEQRAQVETNLRTERERAHEIRTALLVIEGATRSLQREHRHLDAAEQTRLGEAIGAEIAHLRELTTPPPVVAAEPLDLYRLVEQQATLARSRSMSVEVRGDPTVRAAGKRKPVMEALDNLFSNAERYASRDGRVAVTVEIGRDNGSAIVRVEDDGPGIRDGWRHLIFERGWYGDPRSGGEGIGLPVSRQLIRELGGDLRLAAPNGSGAAFVVSLPVAADDAGPVPDETQDGTQVVELRGGLAVRLVHHPSAPGVVAIVQHDRDVSGNGGGLGRDDGQVEPRLPRTVVAHDVTPRRPRRAPVPSRIVPDRVVEEDGHLDVIPKEYA